jgi:aquaporin NIP
MSSTLEKNRRYQAMTKRLLSEFIGTYFLVFAGTGAIMIDNQTRSLSLIGIAFTFGLVVMAMIYTFGHISGAHFNPAVTSALWFHGSLSAREAISYIMTQVTAALLASTTLLLLFGNVSQLGTTLPRNSWQQSFVLEFILTFILMLVIFGSAVHGKAAKSFAGLAIGATVGLEVLIAGPISGASMNPARSIGPALISGTVNNLWVYIVATLLGALASAIVYKFLQE